MVGSGLSREEFVGSQCEDHFVNLERRRDREVSVHTTHNSRIHSRTGSHISHGEETRNLRLEVDHLRIKLHRKQREASPSSIGSNLVGDSDCRPRSRTPLSDSISLSSLFDREERYYQKKGQKSNP